MRGRSSGARPTGATRETTTRGTGRDGAPPRESGHSGPPARTRPPDMSDSPSCVPHAPPAPPNTRKSVMITRQPTLERLAVAQGLLLDPFDVSEATLARTLAAMGEHRIDDAD